MINLEMENFAGIENDLKNDNWDISKESKNQIHLSKNCYKENLYHYDLKIIVQAKNYDEAFLVGSDS